MTLNVRSLSLALGAAILLSLAGCGGGGVRGSRTPSRSDILKLLGRGVADSASLRGGAGRSPKKAVHGVAPVPTASKPGGSFGKREADTNPIVFNEETGLWEKQQPGVDGDPTIGSGTLFFEDEAGTIPAGSDLTYASDGISWPRWVRTVTEYKAGKRKGWKVTDYAANNEDGSGVHTATGHYPGESDFTLGGRWDATGQGVWTERWDFVDKTWENQVWTMQEDFSGHLVITNDAGVTFDMNWLPDASGTGTIAGRYDGLPANMQWDANGDGTITWADGSKTSFTAWQF